MRIIKKMLRYQTCVYWAPGPLNEEAQHGFLEPVEIKCRWEECTEEFIDKGTGNPQTSKAKVYVGEDLKPLGVLWLPPENLRLAEGQALEQLEHEDAPFDNDGAYEIRKIDKIGTLKLKTQADFLRICWL